MLAVFFKKTENKFGILVLYLLMAKEKKKKEYHKISANLRPGLKEKVTKKAQKENRTVSEIIDELLYDYISR